MQLFEEYRKPFDHRVSHLNEFEAVSATAHGSFSFSFIHWNRQSITYFVIGDFTLIVREI